VYIRAFEVIAVSVWAFVATVSDINLKVISPLIRIVRQSSQAHLTQTKHLAVMITAIWHDIIEFTDVISQVCWADLSNEIICNL
jgi:hypothetical protein